MFLTRLCLRYPFYPRAVFAERCVKSASSKQKGIVMKKTLKQQVLEKFQGYEEERREQARIKREAEDRAWAEWIDTPEALVEILKDSKLATRPSERIYSASDILRMIMEGRNP